MRRLTNATLAAYLQFGISYQANVINDQNALLAPRSSPANAMKCHHASGRVGHEVCNNPRLREADGNVTSAYHQVIAHLSPAAKSLLIARQLRWIVKRDRSCASGTEDCLKSAYAARQEYMDALLATEAVGRGTAGIADLDPIVLRGVWQALELDGVGDSPPFGPFELESGWSVNSLPQPGQRITARPGELCFDRLCHRISIKPARISRALLAYIRSERWGTGSLRGFSVRIKDTSFDLALDRTGRAIVTVNFCVGTTTLRCSDIYQVWDQVWDPGGAKPEAVTIHP